MGKEWGVLKIDEKHMWASLALNKPETEEDLAINVPFIMNYLKESGICTGIIEGAVHALVETAPYEKEIIVAQGIDSLNGMDGIYKYIVPLEDSKSKPVVNEDGTVDYANSLKIATVDEGQAFAVYVAPTKGIDGETIFGEVVPAVPGKEPKPLRGKGIAYDEENKEYIATYSGRIYKENEKIVIDKIYVVNGELSLEHGNINFNGDVEIYGDVRSGLKIETEGSIFIHGHVGNCKLIAGKNITIEKGVQGKMGCEIIAGGDVAGSFMESCVVKSEGNVYANSMLNCKVFARGQVVVMSKTGHIIGGMVVGVQGVKAKVIGNEAFTVTRVNFRELLEYERLLLAKNQEKKKLLGDIELLDKQIKVYDNIEGSDRTKETEALRMKIVRAKVICSTNYREVEELISKVSGEIILAKRESRVVVTDAIYPGSIIGSSGTLMQVNEAFKEVSFRMANGNIVMESSEEEEK